MKKGFCFIIVVVMILNLLVFASDLSEEKFLYAYFINKNDYNMWIRQPSSESLSEVAEAKYRYRAATVEEYNDYKLSSGKGSLIFDDTVKCIKQENLNNPEYTIINREGWGVALIGNPIYISLIEFTNSDKLKNFINRNGYAATTINASLVSSNFGDSFAMLPIIYAETNDGEVFISISPIPVDEELLFKNDIYMDDNYLYTLYTKEGYVKQYGERACIIKVEGDIVIDEGSKIQFMGAYIPLRKVMEQMGVEVDWRASDGNIILGWNEDKYIFDPKRISLTKIGDDVDLFPRLYGGYAPYTVKLENDKYYADLATMKMLLTVANAEIFIDYAKSEINIMFKSE